MLKIYEVDSSPRSRKPIELVRMISKMSLGKSDVEDFEVIVSRKKPNMEHNSATKEALELWKKKKESKRIQKCEKSNWTSLPRLKKIKMRNCKRSKSFDDLMSLCRSVEENLAEFTKCERQIGDDVGHCVSDDMHFRALRDANARSKELKVCLLQHVYTNQFDY